MSSKYFRPSDNFQCDEELEPHENLAAAIIRRAVMDARRLNAGKPVDGLYKSNYNEYELREFFNSRWCGVLLSGTSLSGEDLKKAVCW